MIGLPGVRIASGSLGQGLSVGIGAAQKLNGDKQSFTHFTEMEIARRSKLEAYMLCQKSRQPLQSI
jgi:transketolase